MHSQEIQGEREILANCAQQAAEDASMPDLGPDEGTAAFAREGGVDLAGPSPAGSSGRGAHAPVLVVAEEVCLQTSSVEGHTCLTHLSTHSRSSCIARLHGHRECVQDACRAGMQAACLGRLQRAAV